MIEQMFEHWCRCAYYDDDTHVFPSDELLDEMQLHETWTRNYVAGVFRDFAVNFNQFLIDRRAYDYFCFMGFSKVQVNNETAVFS